VTFDVAQVRQVPTAGEFTLSEVATLAARVEEQLKKMGFQR
jgi:hypothetical protein